MYLFPYEKVKCGARVLIHGYGRAGREMACQISRNNYCKVLAFVDRNANIIDDCPYKIVCFDDAVSLKPDYVVIAIVDSRLAMDIRSEWLKWLDEDCVVLISEELTIENKPVVVKGVPDNILHIAFWCTSGVGDCLMDYVLACKIKQTLGARGNVTVITDYWELFDGERNLEITCNSKGATWDILFHNISVPRVECWAPNKVRQISNRLYEFCIGQISFLSDNTGYLGVWTYARLFNKSFVNITDPFGIMGLDDYKLPLLSVCDNETVLRKFNLYNYPYIVVNRDVDKVQTMQNYKLWPIEYYEELISYIKYDRPYIKVIQIGSRREGNCISGCDEDLTGETSLKEVKSILNGALFLISGEGGLVHVNHFVGGKSVVLYGPTDEEFFGYENDIACTKRSEVCNTPCNYIRRNHIGQCLRGKSPAECMIKLTPEYVYQRIQDNNLLTLALECDLGETK